MIEVDSDDNRIVITELIEECAAVLAGVRLCPAALAVSNIGR
jgi:hypothetical protein